MQGYDGRTVPPDEATAPQWPVLARLPYVGADDEHAAPRAWRHDRVPPAPVAVPPHINPSLRLADEADKYPPQSYEHIEYVESAPKPRPEPRYRIDAGQPRGPVRRMAATTVSPHDESQTLAARVFQWHAALAPYAGLAMTFVLATFAGLLYWSTFARPEAPASAPAAAAPEWTADIDATPNHNRNFWSTLAPSSNTPESPLLGTPRVTLDLPPLGELAADGGSGREITAPAFETEPAIGAVSEEAKPIEEVADPGPEAVVAEPQLTNNGDGVAPTPVTSEPAPLTTGYPTTPFASFDFGPAAQQAAAPADSPAPAATR